MRLIEQGSDGEFRLQEFFTNPPPYGILSHLWGSDEVTFHELQTGTSKEKDGFLKLQFCAQQTRQDGLRYFWVDTCCIDKSSSAELTEAINSMFQWYRDAAKCYVYLSDISMTESRESEDPSDSLELQFRKSRWFSRGWTLQELLAPKKVEFFSSEGYLLGNKATMAQQIYRFTGIPITALQGYPLSGFSVAERFSWTALRQTTRVEDQAYCLLGIFDVHMPIIYGEGKHALRRLQEEIRKIISTSSESTLSGMRLLVAASNPLRIETVPINDSLQYAILSHRWGRDEVLFDDIRNGTTEQRQGYSKIRRCCNLAVMHGFSYVWVDTCCIDKSSSSELQEAICSMYKWYKNAKICYVYLEDCAYDLPDSFEKSRWFKRGWTLQELLAPRFVEFYDQNWNEIGTKQSLCSRITRITSIDSLVLRGANPTERTIAERMSWASSRSTTRIEDTAYCLMGIFNVFMPMLYGEGNRAFIRLQEEIIKQTEDYTMFAWKTNYSGSSYRGIFAHSPAEFSASGPERIVPRFIHPSMRPDAHQAPVMTSRGLVVTLPVIKGSADEYLGWVACSIGQADVASLFSILCIRLREIQSSPQTFARFSVDRLQTRPGTDLNHFEYKTVCVLPSTVDQSTNVVTEGTGELSIGSLIDDKKSIAPILFNSANGAIWDDEDQLLTYTHQDRTCTLAAFRFEVEEGFFIVIGLRDNTLWCSIVTKDDFKEGQNIISDLNDLSVLAGSPETNTDRARSTLSSTKGVTAAIRIARFINPFTPKFGLHVAMTELTEQ